MVAIRRILNEPEVVWRSANPAWRDYAGLNDAASRIELRTPMILRFDSDTFIEDFMALLQRAPARMREWQVAKETWRLPLPTQSLQDGLTPTANWQLPNDPSQLVNEPLKLYQPAHERYYLVTASLICRIPGLPDKMLNFSGQEKATFVIRRKMRKSPGNTEAEYAFVNGMWQEVEESLSLHFNADGVVEEQFPLFPTHYVDDLTGIQRRVFAGLIPVAQREKFLTAGRTPTPTVGGGGGTPTTSTSLSRKDKLMTLFDVDVVSPWLNLTRQIWLDGNITSTTPICAPPDTKPEIRGSALRAICASWDDVAGDSGKREKLRNNTHIVRKQFQTTSWYTMLDFMYFLQSYLYDVWSAVVNKSGAGLTGAKATLFQLLNQTYFRGDSNSFGTLEHIYEILVGREATASHTSMVQALESVWRARTALENVTDEPDLNFLLMGRQVRGLVHRPGGVPGSSQIEIAVRNALSNNSEVAGERIAQIPTAKGISDNTKDGDYSDDEFVIRCIFERPNCPPNVRPDVVSLETQRFTMAAFFDPDAPSRPFRIPMPVDTTPAGIRKFAKNTMFVLSDTLACQVEAARNITFGDLVLSVLPWPFHKPLPEVGAGDCKPGINIGKLCTLSIPIITICALILLIIIVLLLDIIFKWIPYLIFCLPLPGLKAKD